MPDNVREDAVRMVKASYRLRELQALRQAKVAMIAMWHKEIAEVDTEIAKLVKLDPHLDRRVYPMWLQDLM